MARSVTQALSIECVFSEWDPTGEEKVWIRQARGKEIAQRDRLFSQTAVERNTLSGRVRELYELSGAELARKEAYLTLMDCTLTEERVDAKTGTAELVKMFTPGMSESEFSKAWDRLPRELIVEWVSLVRDVNPQWDPFRSEELEKN